MEVTPFFPLILRGKGETLIFKRELVGKTELLQLMSCHQILRRNGHRLTPQRMLVIEALHNADRHISAEELYEQLHSRYPYANISTVYRTLELLKKLNLVTETNLGEGYVRYHVAEKGHHHHLVCRSCGKTIDLEEFALHPLKDTLLKKYGFAADLRHLAISGECSGCRRKKETKAKQPL